MRNTDRNRPKSATRQAKRAVELCSMCGNNMRLPNEDKIKYDYSLPPKHSGVCSYCADISHHAL